MKLYSLLLAVLGAAACLPATNSVGNADATDSTTDSTTGTVAQTEGTTATGEPPCNPDEPVGGGVYLCGGPGHQHQKEPATCELAEPRPCETPGEAGNCMADADCEGAELCEQHEDVDFGSYCRCEPPTCETTADCGPDSSCHCGANPSGSCVPSNCATDEDCDGQLCAVSLDACGVQGLFCTTDEDLCDGNEFACVYVPENGRWEPSGAIGCP
jgi:hypothetical protein